MMKIFIPVLLLGSIATVHAHNHDDMKNTHQHRHMHKQHIPFERIDNLTDEQKIALEKLKPKSDLKKNFIHGPTAIKNLDPSAEDYQVKVNNIAEKIAQQAKTHFLEQAERHAKVHQILTSEQRQQLKQGSQCHARKNSGK